MVSRALRALRLASRPLRQALTTAVKRGEVSDAGLQQRGRRPRKLRGRDCPQLGGQKCAASHGVGAIPSGRSYGRCRAAAARMSSRLMAVHSSAARAGWSQMSCTGGCRSWSAPTTVAAGRIRRCRGSRGSGRAGCILASVASCGGERLGRVATAQPNGTLRVSPVGFSEAHGPEVAAPVMRVHDQRAVRPKVGVLRVAAPGPGAWRLEIRGSTPAAVPQPWGSHRGVLFARAGSRFTRDFEDLVGWLATTMDKTALRRLMRIDWDTIGQIIDRVIETGLDPKRLDDLFVIGGR